MIDPLHLYAAGLLNAGLQPLRTVAPRVRLADGTLVPFPLERYVAPADQTDLELLRELSGPVLDVGCGPGRHLHALAARGVFALGVDLSAAAVELARGRGGRAIVGSVFDEIPGNGTWRSAILLDGNVGIGGAPARLLARLAALLCADGEVLLELDPPQTPSLTTMARIESSYGVSSWFAWARVSSSDLNALAAGCGFAVTASWSVRDRWFARLRRGAR